MGFVAALGAGVKGIKEGDRVGVPWLHTACGHCEHCITGWETLCDAQQMTGYTANGGYAEYVLADPGYLGHLPAQISFAAIAPVQCAGLTVYKGLKVLDCKPGDWVAISGIGGPGHFAVQYAKAMGFHVIAVDIDDAKLALATKLGADMVIHAGRQDPVAEVQRELRGAHGVLVTAVSRSAFGQALGMLHKRGTMSLVGLPPGDSRCRSSMSCSTPRPCVAPSSAPARICKRRSSSPLKAKCIRSIAKTASTTSMRCSSACAAEPSTAAS